MAIDQTDTILDLLRSLRQAGAQEAVVAFAEDGSANRLSYASLDGLIGVFAQRLRDNGIGRGEPVAVLSEHGVPAVVARLALLALGAVAVNLDPDASVDEWRRELGISASRLLIVTPRYRKVAEKAAESSVPLLIVSPSDLERKPAGSPLSPLAAGADETAAIFFTSGTTGPPKGVPLTRRNMSATVAAVVRLGLIDTGDCVLLPLPLHHSYPFLIGLLVTLASRATLVLPAALTGPQLGHALREGRITAIVGVPRLYEAFLQSIEARIRARGALAASVFEAMLGCAIFVQQGTGVRLGRLLFRPLHRELGGRLRIMASGGARLDAQVAKRLCGLGFTVLEGYGLVETASVSTFNPPRRPILGSVGLPAPGVDIRIDEPDREGQGEILIRGPTVFAGYLHDAEATARAFAPGGWFRTGDLGRLDREGYLYVTGRLKEIIVLPDGKKIAPEELEAVYSDSPFIRELALLETKDGLQALVVPDFAALREVAGSPEDAIRVALSEIGQGLPAYQRLSGFALTHAPLPRTHLGKYARRDLPILFEQALRHQRKPSTALTEADRALLDDPLAGALWNWLQERFRGQALDLDTSPQLDLGVDSLGWVALGLDIETRFQVRLPEETISRVVTLRDLVHAVRDAAEARPEQPPSEAPAVDAQFWTGAPTLWQAAIARLLFGLVWAAARALFRLKVHGAGNIPQARPLIIAANHASDLDPFMLAAALPLSLLKDSYWGGDAARLFGTALSRWLAKAAHVFPIDDRAPKASLARAGAVLDQRKALLWFPESWRSPTGKLQRFLPGIGRLIREHEVIVVPAYIEGAFEALPRQARIPRLAPIHVTFGAAVSLASLREKAPDLSDASLADALRKEVAALAEAAKAMKSIQAKRVD